MAKFLASSIEALEPRIAPASIKGVVSNGTLKLTPVDPTDNVEASLFQVNATTFRLSEGNSPDFIDFTGVKNIQITLTDLNDSFFFNLNGESRGSIAIDTGLGDDDLIGLDGMATRIGKTTVTSDGKAAVNVGTLLALRGSLQIESAGGDFNAKASLGHLAVKGAANVILEGVIHGNATITAAPTGTLLWQFADAQTFGNLTFIGKEGPDTADLQGSVAGKLTVKGGEGANTLKLTNNQVRIGSLAYIGGSGPDIVQFSPATNSPDPVLGGLATISLGNGANSFTAGGVSHFAGGLRINGGTGTDAITFTDGLTISGALQLALGAGTNSLTLGYTVVHGGLRYVGKDGADTVNLNAGRISGATTITLGLSALGSAVDENQVNLGAVYFGGALTVKGGLGEDRVIVSGSSVLGRLTAVLGNDSNLLQVNSGFLRQGFVYQGGSMTDTVVIKPENTFLYGVGTVKTGDGTNSFDGGLAGLNAFSYTGGAGEDDVTILNFGAGHADVKVMLGAGDDDLEFDGLNFNTLKADGGLGIDRVAYDSGALELGASFKNFEITPPPVVIVNVPFQPGPTGGSLQLSGVLDTGVQQSSGGLVGGVLGGGVL